MRLSTFVIGPNERLEIAASGNYIRVRESAADLLIEHPRTNEVIEVSQGDDFEFDQFSSLYVTNLSASQVTAKLIFSQDKKAGSSKVGGSVNVAGDIALNAATLAAMNASIFNASLPEYTNSFSSNALISGGNYELMIDPSVNISGIIIVNAGFSSGRSSTNMASILANTVAPTSYIDGDIVLARTTMKVGTVNDVIGALQHPMLLPAGKGLYFYSTSNETSDSYRFVNYRIL